MQIGKGMMLLLLWLAALAGIGAYHLAVARGILSVSIPYEAQGYMDYSIQPASKKR